MARWPVRTLEERFWEKVAVAGPDECWIWQAGSRGEYGAFCVGRATMVGAHRMAVVLDGREVAPSDDVHHLCENKLCCNPVHLVVLAHNVHVLEHHPRQARCQRGHLKVTSPRGRWICRECDAERKRSDRAAA